MSYDLVFDIGATKKNFEYIEFTNKKTKNGEITFTAVVESDKVYSTKFGEKSSFTFPTKVDTKFTTLIADLCSKVQEHVPEWSVNNPALRDVFYIKLGFDDKKQVFKTTSNIKFDPNSEESLVIPRGKNVVIKAKLMAWFQMGGEKAGVSLNVTSVKFD